MVFTVMNWQPNNKSCMHEEGTEEEMACKQVARVRRSLNAVIRVDSFSVFGCKEGGLLQGGNGGMGGGGGGGGGLGSPGAL